MIRADDRDCRSRHTGPVAGTARVHRSRAPGLTHIIFEPIEPRLLMSAAAQADLVHVDADPNPPSTDLHQDEMAGAPYVPPKHHLFDPGDFLSDPVNGEPLAIALNFLRGRAGELGLDPGDLDHYIVTDQYTSPDLGVTHIYLRQTHNDLEVAGADINVNVTTDGRVVNVGSNFIGGLSMRAEEKIAPAGPVDALASLAERFGWALDGTASASPAIGKARVTTLAPAGVSLDPIAARLHYVPVPGGDVELAWNMVVRTPDGEHWLDTSVRADDGELLSVNDWTSDASYNVIAAPGLNPLDAARTVVVDPHDLDASPEGWHDTSDVLGVGEFTDTRGNNVLAQEDTDANNSGGFRPDGTAALTFDFPIDFNADPSTYQSAAITNLFYWNNLLHDIFFHNGFNEAAGNFQETNHDEILIDGTLQILGEGGDPVRADAQDGSGIDNANFSTPPDGSAPRMQMFEWIPQPLVIVNSTASLPGAFDAGVADFGPQLTLAGTTGDLVIAEPDDACGALTNGAAVSGHIVVIDRKPCTFVTKVRHAQEAGAIGVIMVNNVPGGNITMADDGTGGDITIPSVFMTMDHGNLLKAAVASGPVNVTLQANPLPNLDSSLDSGIIAHEYGHGVSTRLTGGPANSNGLTAIHNSGMGEGWSDFFALMLTQEPSDNPADAFGIGAYLLGQPSDGAGIRNFPYSFDMSVSPLTFADISTANRPHGVGEIWASALWDLNWLLVNGDGGAIPGMGFNPNLTQVTGGNNVALQLVIDGLKLQPSNPSFIEARDAILLADTQTNGGANHPAIWTAFARRGMGQSASDGSNPNTLSVIESFDVPFVFTLSSVIDVVVSSSAWTDRFLDHMNAEGLGNGGYSIPVGSSRQLDALPWRNADRLTMSFSEKVDIDQDDLTLVGVLGPDGINDADVTYVFSNFSTGIGPSGHFEATWTLAEPLAVDRMRITLNGSSMTGVTDLSPSLYLLDGEWTNEVSTYPSGNRSAGGDFVFDFNVLSGDADADGMVDAADQEHVLAVFGSFAGTTNYSIFDDLDGDGFVVSKDLLFSRSRASSALPPGSPAATSEPQPGATSSAAETVLDDEAFDAMATVTHHQSFHQTAGRTANPSTVTSTATSTATLDRKREIFAAAFARTAPVLGRLSLRPARPATSTFSGSLQRDVRNKVRFAGHRAADSQQRELADPSTDLLRRVQMTSRGQERSQRFGP